jgi:hypothetical protein
MLKTSVSEVAGRGFESWREELNENGELRRGMRRIVAT